MRFLDYLQNLLMDIEDPRIRGEILRTATMVFYAWESGTMKDEDFKKALYEIVLAVLEEAHPDWPDEELRERAKQFAEELYRKARLETMFRRMRTRFGPF
ncbi:MAG: hypothetical protein J7K15_10220 [Deltaproteobacteria bacterium]|nr:hypothetical protein [Deltaproteobacteria bacterium]